MKLANWLAMAAGLAIGGVALGQEAKDAAASTAGRALPTRHRPRLAFQPSPAARWTSAWCETPTGVSKRGLGREHRPSLSS